MPYKFNPFTGTFDDSTAGPQGAAGTVSAAGSGTAALPGIAFATDLNTGIYNPGPDELAVATNSTERMRFTSDAYVRLAAGTGGIQFNGDTAAANALDDYEEGTWTPELAFGGASTGITYNARQGYYVKIGKQVFLTVYFNLTSKGTATGSATVAGLPFTAEDFNIGGTSNWPGAAPSRRQNETSTNFAMMVGDNTATILCTNGGGIAITDAAFTNGTIIECAFTYRAA